MPQMGQRQPTMVAVMRIPSAGHSGTAPPTSARSSSTIRQRSHRRPTVGRGLRKTFLCARRAGPGPDSAVQERDDQVEPEQHRHPGEHEEHHAARGRCGRPRRALDVVHLLVTSGAGDGAAVRRGEKPDPGCEERHDDAGGDDRDHEDGDEGEPVDRHTGAPCVSLRLPLTRRTAEPAAITSASRLEASTRFGRARRNTTAMKPTASTVSRVIPTGPSRTIRAATAPTTAAAGRVNTHPVTTRRAVDQRTWEPRRPRPDPMTEPDATCVVERANPRCVDARIVVAVLTSAEKPCAGLTAVRPVPIVLMIRQPPVYVPAAMARAHATITQVSGALPGSWTPAAMRVSVITPMVFCASFVPCASATSEELNSWPTRNTRRPSGRPSCRRVIEYASRVAQKATIPAVNGASSAGMMTLPNSTL